MKRIFKCTLLIIGLLLSCHTTYAQGELKITITQNTNGGLCNTMTAGARANAKNYEALRPKNLKECEELKREVLSNPDFRNSCFTVQCDCVGFPASSTNSDFNDFNPFNNPQINFNDPVHRGVFLDPAATEQDWYNQFKLQRQLQSSNSHSLDPKLNDAIERLLRHNQEMRDVKPKSIKSADYDLFKELGANAGVNIANFFNSVEEWVGTNLTSDEWDEKFKQFTKAIDDANRMDREKRIDDFETALMLTGIDMLEHSTNVGLSMAETTGPVGAIVKVIVGSATGAGAEIARQHVTEVGEPIVWSNVGRQAFKGGVGNFSIEVFGVKKELRLEKDVRDALDAGISTVTTKFQGGTNVETGSVLFNGIIEPFKQ